MEKARPYSKRDLQRAKNSIELGYFEGRDLGIYLDGLGISDETIEGFEGKRVLDLGAGKKLKFARHLEQAGIHAEVISLSPAFADESERTTASTWYGQRDVPGQRMVAGMGEELPIADSTFDRVVCFHLVQHLENLDRIKQVAREIERVLAPGGTAWVAPFFEKGREEDTVLSSKEEAAVKLQIEEVFVTKPQLEWQDLSFPNNASGPYNYSVLVINKPETT